MAATQLRTIDKKKIIDAVLTTLRLRSERMAALAEGTREDAVHEESRAENDKDTRGLEASYLARGQARRVAELNDDMANLKFMDLRTFKADTPIGLGALIELEDEEEAHSIIFIASGAGGLEVDVDGHRVRVINPASPLGLALIDRVESDDVVLELKGTKRELLIVAVK